MTQDFDAIIVGAGQAGPSLAARLTAAGMKTALIERKLFGGTCVNTGCMPTKTLVASAYAAHLARRGADFGIVTAGPVAIDMKRVKARADAVSTKARTNVETWLRGMDGLTAAAREVEDAGSEALVAPCDVADHAAVEAAARKIEEKFGSIDIWINVAFAGVLAAPIYAVNPMMGANLIIVVFAVVVIGGMGSILGAIVTGFALGLIEGLTKVFYPEAAATVIFVIMAIVLLVKPAGLFGKR